MGTLLGLALVVSTILSAILVQLELRGMDYQLELLEGYDSEADFVVMDTMLRIVIILTIWFVVAPVLAFVWRETRRVRA